jgi:DNA-binding MarR family transcriptional regulator
MPDDRAVPPVTDRLGYLLKHARLRLSALSAQALDPLGISGRELAVLTVIAGGPPPSQLEAAQRLGIDRTSMVALLDELEGKGLAIRQPDPADRRRNVVGLTGRGRSVLAAGAQATDAVERTFLAALTPADAARLRALLQAVAHDPEP